MSSEKNLGKMIVAVLVMVVFVGALAALMPAIRRGARAPVVGRSAAPNELARRAYDVRDRMASQWKMEEGTPRLPGPGPAAAQAVIRSYNAWIELMPRLSIGTPTPESIYQLDFKASIEAEPASGDVQSQILLPIPPEIVSLSNLEYKINGERCDDFSLREGYLVLQGRLVENEPSQVEVTYSAVGKGIFILGKPAGRVVDVFKASLVTHKSDIRMLELSLQPNEVEHGANITTYKWDYPRLLVARPIIIDVLGISAVDMLGELTWTGPVAVAIFALLYVTIALASKPEKFSFWTMMLVTGCFSAGFPLMYFMQEYNSLGVAVSLGTAVVTLIVAWRTISLFGWRVGMIAGVGLPVVTMLLTVGAALAEKVSTRGTFLTIEAIVFLVLAMIYLPKAKGKLGYTHVIYQEGQLPTPQDSQSLSE